MTTSPSKRESRLNLRLPGELKELIEAAAALHGLSVGDFAVSVLIENAQRILQQDSVTRLSARDGLSLLNALDKTDAKPNKALSNAAKKYLKRSAAFRGFP